MKKLLVLLLPLMMITLTACSRRAVRDYTRRAPLQTQAQIEKAFLYACNDRGWLCEEKPGSDKVRGSLQKGKFYIEIEMIAKPEAYTFRYVDSENLKYKKGKIHKGYYRWLNYLQRSVYSGLAKPELMEEE